LIDIFFIFNGFHIGFQYYMAIGIPGSGSAGIINAISMLSDGRLIAGIFGIITAVLWSAGGTYSLYLYRQVHHHYRIQGHTFADAKGDALETMTSSGLGRQAVSSYARTQASQMV
jgi:hypothetical protein